MSVRARSSFFSQTRRAEFYFLEMNTRLQVEHPVTELVTGFDLVREQVNVAAGGKLSFTQERCVAGTGMQSSAGSMRRIRKTISCRRREESRFCACPTGPGIRDDSGVTEGDEVSIYYDPMISKLAAWGLTRAEAIDRMRRALDEYAVGGIKTTLPFFREIVRDEEFVAGRLDTGFIPRFNERRR